jgi:hypothetical protein
MALGWYPAASACCRVKTLCCVAASAANAETMPTILRRRGA